MEESVLARPLLPRVNNQVHTLPERCRRPGMHELSIAMSIVEMASEEAERRGVQVEAVHLELGALSGVVKEALLFSYEMPCNGTPLAGSRLLVKDIPIEVLCPSCRAQR